MTDQEVYAALLPLVQELSAAGDIPITSPEGNKLSLRAAIRDIYGKTKNLLTLTGRPRDPKLGDDLFGQVLNTRTEGLVTQALVVAICIKLGIDYKTISANVVKEVS